MGTTVGYQYSWWVWVQMVEMGTGVWVHVCGLGSCVGNGYSYWESVQVVAMAQGFGVKYEH